MYIKELQLTGFKSFQQKTTLRFSSGMSAIIGPNGCGKTNILDALRWVLGEQSFNMLRCSKTEDLIFGGTTTIPATNYADVRLILANDSLPDYPAEIEIRRRFFRTGESEYFLNRQPCRQKDIQELFLASGIGTKAYSIFDLRQMREIIAGNIRRMFEEASNLAKYQEAKADCERKLALTEADLTRLEDIIAERERVVRSLRYQAGKLRSWEKLKEEEKGYRLVELKAEFNSLGRELEALEKDIGSLEQADADRLVEVRRLEEELHQHRARLRQEQSLKDDLVSQAQSLRTRLSELEGRVLIGTQKAEFLLENARNLEQEKDRLAASTGELEQLLERSLQVVADANRGLEQREQALQQAQEVTRAAERKLYDLRSHEQTQRELLENLLERQHELRSRLVHSEAVTENVDEAVTRVKLELAEVEQRLDQCRKDEAGLQEHESAVRTRNEETQRRVSLLETELAQLEQERRRIHEELTREREQKNWVDKDLAVLSSAGPDRRAQCNRVLGEAMLGPLTQFVSVEPGWERACEAALQPVLDFLVTRDEPTVNMLERLADARLEAWCGFLSSRNDELVGSGTALSSSQDTPQSNTAAATPEIGPRTTVERLSDHVEVMKNAPGLLRELVQSFVVADTQTETWNPEPGTCVVSKQGWARFSDGRIVVAAHEQGQLRLDRLKAEKRVESEQAAIRVLELENRERELEIRCVELDRQLEEVRAVAVETSRQKSLLDAKLETVTAKLQELDRDRSRILAELNRLGGTKSSNQQTSETLRAELSVVVAEIEQQTGNLALVEKQVREQEKVARDMLDQAAQRLAELAEQRQQVARLEAESGYARRQVEERRRRIVELARAAEKAGQDAAVLRQEAVMLEPEIERTRAELACIETRIDQLKVTALAEVEEELERNLTELRRAREQSQTILMEQRMREQSLRQRRQAIEDEARTEYKTELATFEPAEVEDVVARLAQVRQRLSALGAVNPLAADDYRREREDLERVISQRDDVVTARNNLTQTLAEIDRHAKERFLATYGQVRAHFREIFRQMFLEGEADLVLTDETRPLESEVAIVARPRGKNPKRLEQLSDGEKALLAVSLLFAFYRVKPAPFCFLDEVDAPLDDANVGRFADYLKELSSTTQVIVITHNRLTVERAEALFGVTAEQPGVSTLVSVSLADYKSSAAAVAVS